jgi:hypothetical protein
VTYKDTCTFTDSDNHTSTKDCTNNIIAQLDATDVTRTYSYDLDEWGYGRTVHAEGNDRNPVWPEYSLNLEGQTRIGAERAGARSETYTVHFQTNEKDKIKQHSYRTSQSEWMEYAIEHNYMLKINSFGMIMNNPLRDTK